ncbi:hypothetical protein QCA50_013347 [Cerrena zonata]|uniref:Uncharacterized protein n=1 Tax=Cerrena zonata TaxID=2478898 RepID=A0AAW0FP95_9APHY
MSTFKVLDILLIAGRLCVATEPTAREYKFSAGDTVHEGNPPTMREAHPTIFAETSQPLGPLTISRGESIRGQQQL